MTKTEERLQAINSQVAHDIKFVNDKANKAKSTAEEALAKAKEALANGVNGGTSNLTEEDVQRIVDDAITKLIDGAPDTANTLRELAELIENGSIGLSAVTTQINNRLRFDEVQQLTEEQQNNVQKALGLDIDLLADYEAARGPLE